VGNYVYTIGTVAANTTINISAPAGSTVILNITGLVGNNVNFNIAGGLTANDVLYNVTSSSAINQHVNTTITGILLAPTSTVTINAGATLTGQVIAQAITTTGSGNITFTGPVIPEPSSLSVVAIGAAALIGRRFLRRRKSSG
jgi:choice-of-anchor A domain-containing protein